MRWGVAAGALLLGAVGCAGVGDEGDDAWIFSEASRELVSDAELRERIFAALDKAAATGTDPSISKYQVRASTVVEDEGVPRTIIGGNSEYAGYPEAIHGETSLMNHVINHIGPEAAQREVDFLAFYTAGQCGGGGSCGDCRDYLMTTTRWRDLLIVCGQASDHTVHVHRFADSVVPEDAFPVVGAEEIDLAEGALEAVVEAAIEARSGGVSLFTPAEEHLGVAVLTRRGEIYRAAGSDDAAFHYRYPVGAALQQAATYRDYFVTAVAVAGAPGRVPRLSYRDRQYGFEFSSFNLERGYPPIKLIVVEESGAGTSSDQSSEDGAPRRYRLTTFEDALPGAFSAASFMPDAVDRFLEERADPR